jgi:hypothetical protein
MPTKPDPKKPEPAKKTRYDHLTEDDPKAPLAVLVHPEGEGFREKITPKEIDDKKVFLYRCKCGGQHFRHAGYVKVMMPFIETGGEKRMTNEHVQVMVCVACRSSCIWVNGQMYDVSDRVDLEAWEKAEKELHKATGPGGEC